jgi:predicted DNA binding CopG/RHH family protein
MTDKLEVRIVTYVSKKLAKVVRKKASANGLNESTFTRQALIKEVGKE